MRIVQIQYKGAIVAGVVDGDSIRIINGETSTYALAVQALHQATPLADMIPQLGSTVQVDYQQYLDDNLVVPPIHHPTDDAHLLVTGTGLTHLGSAAARNSMHGGTDTEQTDSIRMFRWGVAGGKPKGAGTVGVQPEWFYKGDGGCVVAPNAPLILPNYAKDGGEEPEVAGIYINDNKRVPHRLGFVIGNEYADHIMEKQNYLYLAHSKLRQCSFGPELVLGDLPTHIEGVNTIYRNDKAVWSKPFVSGEDNMSHSIANLQHHHFKYDIFRRPGDVHVHFFGTATVSFADSFVLQDGDVMEIACAYFGKPLCNPLQKDTTPERLIDIKNI